MTTIQTEMRMRYLASERGGWLRIDSPGFYSVIYSHNGGVAIGPSATLAATQAFLVKVDPTIVASI